MSVVKNDLVRTRNFAEDIRGGWEVWLQVECYWLMRKEGAVGVFEREPYYPSGARADFKFSPKNADDTETWIELKTQRHGDVKKAIGEFKKDIDKVDSAKIGKNDSAGAIVVIPSGGAGNILACGAETLKAGRNRLLFYAISKKNVSSGHLEDNYTWPPAQNDATIVLYYRKI